MDINSHVEGNNSSHSLKVQVLNERDTQAHIRKKKKRPTRPIYLQRRYRNNEGSSHDPVISWRRLWIILRVSISLWVVLVVKSLVSGPRNRD